ncbi:GntR family transcriptional regulator [Pelagibius litoralis]|uniref:GntR family transcriptional regulator n=1 Tax=Pelagibius litoralis TaxID=374515 RepID=A0A967KAB1_9PROT|nr:GntR family transcriptional regulator [Pelagibius litoralis]NIA70377.1 GntR family transcriptional regulator [Pelagibius litoralis]
MKQKALSPKEALYQDLKRSILTMNRAPGSDIDEVRLAAEYGLSRTPLREVLSKMAGEGYLELRQHRGAQVSAMTHKTLRDFFLAAPLIYAATSRLAAQNAMPEQIASLKEVQRGFRAAVDNGNIEDRVFYNDRFHALIGEIANNIYLTPSLRRLLIDHARIAGTFYRPRNAQMHDNLATAAEQHDQMIESIETGDEDRAAQLAIDHWTLSRCMIEMFVTPKGLDVPLGSLI